MLVFAVHAVAPVTTTSSPKEIVAIAVIPARYEATRLPGNPLRDIAGRTMVEHVSTVSSALPTTYESAMRCKALVAMRT